MATNGKTHGVTATNKTLDSARRSTPDSEVVMSDDDHDVAKMSLSLHSIKSQPVHRPVRRSSWLAEVQSGQRKHSLGGSSLASGISQPCTPSVENSTNPGQNGTTFPWNPHVWNTTQRSSRLSEVLPSPTTTTHEDLTSPLSRDIDQGLPFDIPLEPNRKVVRSQSYSAGQLEKPGVESTTARRKRAGPPRRTSRPSLLGLDGAGEGYMDSLNEEDDDDDDESNASQGGVKLHGWMPMEAGAPKDNAQVGSPLSHPPVPSTGSESESAIQEEESATVQSRVAAQSQGTIHGLSELSRQQRAQRALWHSSLGFDIPEEDPQSRRHSFAELLPRTRIPSVGVPSHLGNLPVQPPTLPVQPQLENVQFVVDQPYFAIDTTTPYTVDQPSYFSGGESKARNLVDTLIDPDPFVVPPVFTRPVRILHLVSFKCSRADIYYVADGTGLQVRPGDMVIVEGDRGQDLGTVQHVGITMEEAKKLKEEYARKHFENLMMFTRYFPHARDVARAPELQTAGSNEQGSRPAAGDPEPRPKMIKRVAKPDEVHLLREKEGNEAKSKRVCQAKVNEHGLRMEILDAEFQHDYRKLTFFYYAEEYINFNELVTDLFKVYKTRIWMSAINPASFPLLSAPRPPSALTAGSPTNDLGSSSTPAQLTYGRGFSQNAPPGLSQAGNRLPQPSPRAIEFGSTGLRYNQVAPTFGNTNGPTVPASAGGLGLGLGGLGGMGGGASTLGGGLGTSGTSQGPAYSHISGPQYGMRSGSSGQSAYRGFGQQQSYNTGVTPWNTQSYGAGFGSQGVRGSANASATPRNVFALQGGNGAGPSVDTIDRAFNAFSLQPRGGGGGGGN